MGNRSLLVQGLGTISNEYLLKGKPSLVVFCYITSDLFPLFWKTPARRELCASLPGREQSNAASCFLADWKQIANRIPSVAGICKTLPEGWDSQGKSDTRYLRAGGAAILVLSYDWQKVSRWFSGEKTMLEKSNWVERTQQIKGERMCPSQGCTAFYNPPTSAWLPPLRRDRVPFVPWLSKPLAALFFVSSNKAATMDVWIFKFKCNLNKI